MTNWLNFWGLPDSLLSNVSTLAILGGATASGCLPTDGGCGATESLLDIAAVMSIAQDAKIRIYATQTSTDYTSALTTAINDLAYSRSTPGAVFAVTSVECEGDLSPSDTKSIDTLAANTMLSGLSVFAGSGDQGANCDGSGSYNGKILGPADSPHVVAVGGTILAVNNYTDTYNSETWWCCIGNTGGAGGYGVSQFFPEPTYQAKLYPGAGGRSIPDVAMSVGPFIICQAIPTDPMNCASQPGGTIVAGTSLSTPLFAAAWALANQATLDAGNTPWSPANGYFYSHTGGLHSPSTFAGGVAAGNIFQHVGLGSPDIARMISIAVPPRMDSFSPKHGWNTGGTLVTVTGAGFIDISEVTVGGYAVSNLSIESDTKISFYTPPAHSATAAIEIVTPGGTATFSTPFWYAPSVFNVTPTSGPFEGGTTITVTGAALSAELTFQFGSSLYTATDVTCSTSQTCTMTTPAHAIGTVDVVAVSPWASSTLVAADKFKYLGPWVSSISPLVGPTVLPGVQVTIQGISLAAGLTTVNFGSLPVPVSSCSSDHTYCFLTSPKHGTGSVPLSVTVHGTTLTYPQPFTFEVFPTITGISPSRANAGALVTLTGTGFSTVAGQTTFSFFAISVPGACSSTTQCTAVVPTETLGTAQTTAVMATVNGNTSLDSVTFSYATLVKPPPCKGTTCD